MKIILLAIFFTSLLMSCANHDSQKQVGAPSTSSQAKDMELNMDFLDAYKLKIDSTFLYGNYGDFIRGIGLPPKVTVVKKDYSIGSKEELDKIIASAKAPAIVTLHYPGIDMWYSHDSFIVPYTIDFRKTEKSVSYGEIIFNKAYSLEQFKAQFPISSHSPAASAASFFGMVTKEQGSQFSHFTLLRKSKDDPNTTPMIEFTFDNGKLVFILFANF